MSSDVNQIDGASSALHRPGGGKVLEAFRTGSLVVLFFALAAFVGGLVEPFDWRSRKILSALGLALATILVLRPTRRAEIVVTAATVAIGIALAAFVTSTHELEIAFVGVTGLLSFVAARIGRRFPEDLFAALAGALLIRFGWDLTGAYGTQVTDFLARMVADLSAALSERDLKLGPSVVGIPLAAPAALWIIVRSCRIRSMKPLLALPILGAIVAAAPLLIAAPTTQRAVGERYFDHLPILLGFMASVVFVVAAVFGDRPGKEPLDKRGVRAAAAFSLSLIAAVAGAFATAGATPSFERSERLSSRVVFFNRGGFDWDRPQFGSFGGWTGGMFGQLPLELARIGVETSILDRDNVTASDLAACDVFVLINCPKVWTTDEKAVVRAFVENGGSLLVLGDHTDVFGLERGFNSLLDQFGIRFKFDSAYHARESWVGCRRYAPFPSVFDHDEFPSGIAIGASLEIQPPARELVGARFAFSDIGIRENFIGSFLGNYDYADGERLGDLALVAATTLGRGRVVVYGDTSSFQNGGLSSQFEYEISPLFAWLSKPASVWERRPFAVVIGVLLCVIVTAALFIGRRSIAPTMFVVFASIWVVTVRMVDADRTFKPGRGADTAIVDQQSILSDTGHYETGGNAIGPLGSALARMGYAVRWKDAFADDELENCGVVALIAPRREIPEDKAARLMRFMESGGRVILACGAEESGYARALLLPMGLEIAREFLGPLPVDLESAIRDERPRFRHPFPIRDVGVDSERRSFDDPDTTVVARYGDDVIAAYRRRGKGGLLLIGDSWFFASRNTEDTSSYSLGNMMLLDRVARDCFGVDPSSVKSIFPGPPKLE